MQLSDEFIEYLKQFNPVSKCIFKVTCVVVFILFVVAMYFAMAAGRTQDYYPCMELFDITIENIRSVAGLGFFFSILLESVCRRQTGERG